MKDTTPKRPYFGPYFPNFAPYWPHFAPYWGCPGHPLGPFFVAPMLRYAFLGQNLTILVAAGPISVLKVPIFFSWILIIMEIRLKF